MVTPSTSKMGVTKQTDAQTVDEQTKIERSRENARECRRRKKLRYQYLESLVNHKERSVLKLREEIESVRHNVLKLLSEGYAKESSFKTEECDYIFTFHQFRDVSEKIDSGIIPDTLFQIAEPDGHIRKGLQYSSDKQHDVLRAQGSQIATSEPMGTGATVGSYRQISSRKQEHDPHSSSSKPNTSSAQSLIQHDLFKKYVTKPIQQRTLIQTKTTESACEIKDSDEEIVDWILQHEPSVPSTSTRRFSAASTPTRRLDAASTSVRRFSAPSMGLVPLQSSLPKENESSSSSSEEIEVENYVNYLKDVSDVPSTIDLVTTNRPDAPATNRHFMDTFIRENLLKNENQTDSKTSGSGDPVPSSSQTSSSQVIDDNTYEKFPVLSTLLTEEDKL